MRQVIEKALMLWGMSRATYRLVAARENHVYELINDDTKLALRIHRQNYRTDQELWSELEWMDAVSKGGIKVPAPIPSKTGDLLQIIDGFQIDVLTWLEGSPASEILESSDTTVRAKIFQEIGRQMANLHDISDSWTKPEGFVRCVWDRNGLLGKTPLWDRFWDNPALSTSDRKLFLEFRKKANSSLVQIESDLDYGLIHADLVSANIMVDGDQVQLIDFDDGGFGFRLFDIATSLLKFIDDEDYKRLRTELLKGYQSVRAINLNDLELFMALRSATYVGWNIERIAEEDAKIRNTRFINTARRLAQDYLARQ